MLVPQLYLNGQCTEALDAYTEAFNTTIDSIMYDEERAPDKYVIHAEMHIHGSRVLLSDWSGNKAMTTDTATELVVFFENEEVLKNTYQSLRDGSTTIIQLGEVFYSKCLVSFMDRFGVRWCFMI